MYAADAGVPGMRISEIFPNRVRAAGQALGSTTHWVMAALISWTFPIIVRKTGSGNAFMETISPEGFDFFRPARL